MKFTKEKYQWPTIRTKIVHHIDVFDLQKNTNWLISQLDFEEKVGDTNEDVNIELNTYLI